MATDHEDAVLEAATRRLRALLVKIARLCSAMPESDLGRPTFALALGLAEDPVWEVLDAAEQHRLTRLTARPTWAALSPERPLRHWRLVEITQPAGQPLVTSPLRLIEIVWSRLSFAVLPSSEALTRGRIPEKTLRTSCTVGGRFR